LSISETIYLKMFNTVAVGELGDVTAVRGKTFG
jgi:hypothetical protein